MYRNIISINGIDAYVFITLHLRFILIKEKQVPVKLVI